MKPAVTDAIELTVRELAALHTEERLVLLRRTGDPLSTLTSLVNGVRQLALEDLAEALRAGNWLVELTDEFGDPSARIEARTALATALSYSNDFARAVEALETAAGIAESAGDLRGQAMVSLSTVQPSARMGRYGDAAASAEHAIALFDQLGDRLMWAKAQSNLAVIQRMRDDPAGALHHFDLALSELGDDPVAVAQIQSNRAEALLEVGRFGDAESAFQSALESFEAAGLVRAGAITEGNLADLLGRQGRAQASLQRFERARVSFERGDALGDAARIEAERAEVLASVGLHDEAVRAFESALPRLKAHNLTKESARARAGLGISLIHLRRVDEAEDVLREAEAMFTALDSTTGAGHVRTWLARTAYERSAFEESRRLIDAAKESLSERPAEQLSAFLASASLNLDRGNALQARDEAAVVVRSSRDLGLGQMLASALFISACASDALGDHASAIAALRQAADEVERIRGTFVGDRLRAAWLGEQLSVFRELTRLALSAEEGEDLLTAFEATERGRSRTLLDMVHGGIELAEQAIDAGTLTAEQAPLARELIRERAELSALYSALERLGNDERRAALLRRLQATRERVEDLESRLASSRRLGQMLGRIASLQQVQSSLDKGIALLEFADVGGALGAFVVTRDDAKFVPGLSSMADLREAIEKAAFQINRGIATPAHQQDRAERLASRAREALHRAYNLICRGLEPYLCDLRGIIVVPHGPMYGVPFHALHDGTQYLIERMDVAYAPSASILAAMSEDESDITGGAFVLGVGDERAPRIEHEARGVASLFGDCKAVFGADATRREFLESARGAHMIHLACHGVFADNDPQGARLRLGDGWLSVREIFGLELHGASVTLSCCEAGRSIVQAGDEAMGFIRAFLAAGASSMLVSLWAAHDETSEDLMRLVYERVLHDGGRIERGLGPALANAQRTVLKQRPHPAFWAPFMFIGRLGD